MRATGGVTNDPDVRPCGAPAAATVWIADDVIVLPFVLGSGESAARDLGMLCEW